ncbi:trypsin-like cysteine/serine peptidase domain-containing protein [Hyaloraphidium curvatum]|nr:trypsin-like cysteine/serine peptidase domain-containing protein [Hyaloraphidium curvatum]
MATVFAFLAHALPAGAALPRATVPNIVNGTRAPNGTAYPFFLALITTADGWIGCGAALIAPGFALTAAHCVDGKHPHDLRVAAGRWNISRTTAAEGGTEWPVASMRVHPAYNFPDNDVAVLVLGTPASYGPAPVPIALNADPAFPPPGTPVESMGFGSTLFYGRGPYPKILQRTTTAVIANAQCEAANPEIPFDDDLICAGARSTGICDGDSGGPLVATRDGQPVLVGANSFVVYNCSMPFHYFGTARVSYQEAWIRQVMANPPLPATTRRRTTTRRPIRTTSAAR